jgi:hypothetical protein
LIQDFTLARQAFHTWFMPPDIFALVFAFR